MKKIVAVLSALALLFSLTACGDGTGGGQSGSGVNGEDPASQISQSPDPASSQPPEPSSESVSEPITEKEEGGSAMLKIEITVGEKTFPATLYDNAAARALVELLPMTLDMSELNGNEKYYYLDSSLPTDTGRPAGIHTGDIMLYGDSCLVLFYKSFSTSYSYTVLGRVDDPEDLAAAVGTGDVRVSFRKAE